MGFNKNVQIFTKFVHLFKSRIGDVGYCYILGYIIHLKQRRNVFVKKNCWGIPQNLRAWMPLFCSIFLQSYKYSPYTKYNNNNQIHTLSAPYMLPTYISKEKKCGIEGSRISKASSALSLRHSQWMKQVFQKSKHLFIVG